MVRVLHVLQHHFLLYVLRLSRDPGLVQAQRSHVCHAKLLLDFRVVQGHAMTVTSHLPLFQDCPDLCLLQGGYGPAETPRVVSVEDSEVCIVPDHLISIVVVIRSVMLKRGVLRRRLMSVHPWCGHRQCALHGEMYA